MDLGHFAKNVGSIPTADYLFCFSISRLWNAVKISDLYSCLVNHSSYPYEMSINLNASRAELDNEIELVKHVFHNKKSLLAIDGTSLEIGKGFAKNY